MNKEELIDLKKKINSMSKEDLQERDRYLKGLADGTLQGPPTGYASIDKPSLQFYDNQIFTNSIPNMSAYDYMKYCNQNSTNDIAINFFNKKYTYKDLDNQITKISQILLSAGVKKGDKVTLALPNVPENIFLFYALNKIGAVANIIDLRKKGDMLLSSINGVSSKLLFGCDLFLKNISEIIDKTSVEKAIILSPSLSLPFVLKTIYNSSNKVKKEYYNNKKIVTWEEFISQGKKEELPKADSNTEEEAACILYTSGTSGDAKAVVLTNKALNNMVGQYRELGISYHKGDRFMNQVPPFLAYNIVLSVHMPLCLNLQLIILPNYEPENFAKNISKYEINHVLAGPADWINFLDDPKASKRNYSHLISMGSGSDKINAQVKKNVDDKIARLGGKYKILEGYGLTEASSAVCSNLPNINVENSVGVPFPKTSIAIFDFNDNSSEMEYGKVGEICICGPTLMKEYYNNSEETNNALKIHSDGTTWLHTGDFGYLDNNGILFHVGRMKRIITRYDGVKISPFDIEKIAKSMDIVYDCCVVAVNDLEHGYGSLPCINVVLKEGTVGSEDDIKQLILDECKSKLSAKYSIGKINIMDEFPLTDVKKVDYREIEKLSNKINEIGPKKILK